MAVKSATTKATSKLTKKELIDQIATLRKEMAELRRDRDDLELLLQTTTDHSDAVEEELHTKAEEALRRSEQQLRMIVEATPVPVLIERGGDGEVVFANSTAGPLYGLSMEQLLGRKMADFYCNRGDRERLLHDLESTGGVNRHEVRLSKSDGSVFWAEVSLRRLTFDDAPGTLVAVHDITERKRAAEALQSAVDELTRINTASSRFVPSAFLDFLQKESIVDIELGDHVSEEMTVMFSDIRSFTTMSEGMTPQDNFAFVNAYLRRVSPVIGEHEGFIVKYLGDGLMAIFPNQPDDAIRAGIEQLRRVARYNVDRAENERQPVKIGIGANTGYMMVGMVGESTRIQGDAFSDSVNLTSRIEGLTKFYGVSFVITAQTYERLEDPQRYHIRFIDRVRAKGKSETLSLYEVFDADTQSQRELKLATRPELAAALERYYDRDFAAAQAKLFSVLQRNPQDKVAWHHLVHATHALDSGVDDDWSGVTVMTEK